MKFVFLPADERQRFLQVDTMCVRHAQINQNNKSAISLQYLKKELSVKVDFLHVDKLESFLQIDSMILMGMIKDSQSSQNSKSAMSLQYLKKKLDIKLINFGCT